MPSPSYKALVRTATMTTSTRRNGKSTKPTHRLSSKSLFGLSLTAMNAVTHPWEGVPDVRRPLKTGSERKLIALAEPHEIRDCTETLRVTAEQLRGAANAAGNSAEKPCAGTPPNPMPMMRAVADKCGDLARMLRAAHRRFFSAARWRVK